MTTDPATPPVVRPSAASLPPTGEAARPVRTGAQQVLTVPNVISAARLLGVPLFLWLLLGPRHDVLAIVVLAVAGFSDWADGVLARRLGQYSRLGELLDPLADRLYILAILIGLVLRDVIPWWLAALIIGRDLVLTGALVALRRRGFGPLTVHYLGKAATFNLLYAFPFLLVASGTSTVADVCRPLAWAFTVWGTSLYLWAGGLYLVHTRRVLRDDRLARPSPESRSRPTSGFGDAS